jgi:hypothetical protein
MNVNQFFFDIHFPSTYLKLAKQSFVFFPLWIFMMCHFCSILMRFHPKIHHYPLKVHNWQIKTSTPFQTTKLSHATKSLDFFEFHTKHNWNFGLEVEMIPKECNEDLKVQTKSNGQFIEPLIDHGRLLLAITTLKLGITFFKWP